MCLAPVIRPDRLAPKGQESLAQGLPWVSRNKRFALKGLEIRTRSFSSLICVIGEICGFKFDVFGE